ncbi:hypothetical protein GCM10010270_02360 [Streptomyces violaceus]|nr:hypothetical protein GCM10010270_02360 [Streptomyces janthinus]
MPGHESRPAIHILGTTSHTLASMGAVLALTPRADLREPVRRVVAVNADDFRGGSPAPASWPVWWSAASSRREWAR